MDGFIVTVKNSGDDQSNIFNFSLEYPVYLYWMQATEYSLLL